MGLVIQQKHLKFPLKYELISVLPLTLSIYFRYNIVDN